MAYAGAVEFIQFNERAAVVPLPYQMYDLIGFVGTVVEEADNRPIGIYVNTKLGVVIFTGIFAGVGFGFYTFIYALLYRMMAPPRDVGYDSPPVGKYRAPERGRNRTQALISDLENAQAKMTASFWPVRFFNGYENNSVYGRTACALARLRRTPGVCHTPLHFHPSGCCQNMALSERARSLPASALICWQFLLGERLPGIKKTFTN